MVEHPYTRGALAITLFRPLTSLNSTTSHRIWLPKVKKVHQSHSPEKRHDSERNKKHFKSPRLAPQILQRDSFVPWLHQNQLPTPRRNKRATALCQEQVVERTAWHATKGYFPHVSGIGTCSTIKTGQPSSNLTKSKRRNSKTAANNTHPQSHQASPSNSHREEFRKTTKNWQQGLLENSKITQWAIQANNNCPRLQRRIISCF